MDIPLEPDGFLRLKMPSGSKLLSGAPLLSPRDSFIESPGDLNRKYVDPETGTVYDFTFSWTFGREGESQISSLLKGILNEINLEFGFVLFFGASRHDASPMNTDVSKRSGLGCLGCFSIICLTFVLLVELAVVWWLNPTWFDRVAFWQGPIIPPDVILEEDPGARAVLEKEIAALQKHTRPKIIGSQPVLIEGNAVETDYDPARGAVLETKEGATVRFPPGVLPRPGQDSVDSGCFIA